MAKVIRHTLVRETPDRDPIDNETLMIRMEPGSRFMHIWRKGRHDRLAIRFRDIYRLAYDVEARAAINERANHLTKRRTKR